MSKFNILSFFGKHYGLLIGDSDVSLFSFHKGVQERIAVFGNNDQGIDDFHAFMRKNSKVYKKVPFHILANVIGEEYRVESVPHLIGKYKTDFHSRRMKQLFRNSSFCTSIVQGRGEHGKREDTVLFYGLLSEQKILPWIGSISRGGGRHVAGVRSVAFVNDAILASTGHDWDSGGKILVTMHEDGLVRQTYYLSGKIKFSRISKLASDKVEEISSLIVREIERTIQYLASLKISVSGRIEVRFVCPSNMVGQLREITENTDRFSFSFVDANAVAQNIGLVTPMGELGRDSSLSLQALFSTNIFKAQVAPFKQVRYYYLRVFSKCAVIIFGLYAAAFIIPSLGQISSASATAISNKSLIDELENKKRSYESELRLSEDPPSSAENIAAISQTFRLLSNFDVTPSAIFYYFSEGFSKVGKNIKINDMYWYVSDDINSKGGSVMPFVEGGKSIYQVLEVEGVFLPIPGETYIDVADRADQFLGSFGNRKDVLIDVVQRPSRNLSEDGQLSGTLSGDYEVDVARNRIFRVRIIWKMYDSKYIDGFIQDV